FGPRRSGSRYQRRTHPMKKQSTISKYVAAAASAALVVLAVSMPARADVVLNQDSDLSYIDFNPCGGEPIAVSGTSHVLITQTVDNSGGFHTHFHINYSDVKAVGLITGTTYVVTGEENDNFNATSGALNETLEVRLKFVAPGGKNNFYLYETAHITINANV